MRKCSREHSQVPASAGTESEHLLKSNTPGTSLAHPLNQASSAHHLTVVRQKPITWPPCHSSPPSIILFPATRLILPSPSFDHITSLRTFQDSLSPTELYSHRTSQPLCNQLLFESTLSKASSSELTSNWTTNDHMTPEQLIHRLLNSLSHGLTQKTLQKNNDHQLSQSDFFLSGVGTRRKKRRTS